MATIDEGNQLVTQESIRECDKVHADDHFSKKERTTRGRRKSSKTGKAHARTGQRQT